MVGCTFISLTLEVIGPHQMLAVVLLCSQTLLAKLEARVLLTPVRAILNTIGFFCAPMIWAAKTHVPLLPVRNLSWVESRTTGDPN